MGNILRDEFVMKDHEFITNDPIVSAARSEANPRYLVRQAPGEGGRIRPQPTVCANQAQAQAKPKSEAPERRCLGAAGAQVP